VEVEVEVRASAGMAFGRLNRHYPYVLKAVTKENQNIVHQTSGWANVTYFPIFRDTATRLSGVAAEAAAQSGLSRASTVGLAKANSGLLVSDLRYSKTDAYTTWDRKRDQREFCNMRCGLTDVAIIPRVLGGGNGLMGVPAMCFTVGFMKRLLRPTTGC
jgi:hypothetical protein